MSRKRRGAADDNDSLDLLLDTVSNVFGGVMFLTLLGALLILSRGAASHSPEAVPPSPPADGPPVDDRIVQMELNQLNSAVATQKRVLDNMPVRKGELDKLSAIRNLTEITDELTAEVRAAEQNRDRIEKQLAAREKQHAEMQAAAKKLAEKLASQQESLAKAEQVGRRSVAFRPLEMSSTTEAILVLRYGKVYIFQNSAMNTSYNREDFFAIGTSDGLTSITPKPHRGVAITPESAATLTANLRRNYPPHAFHITIAVWDDSFGAFNPLCDALQSVGYRYRTIPCDDKAKLSFGSVASWVQ